MNILFKSCKHCHLKKSSIEFCKDTRKKDGRCYICRVCHNNRNIIWRKNNFSYDKQWQKNNPTKKAKWRNTNKHKIKQYYSVYVINNTSNIQKRKKEYNDKFRHKVSLYNKEYENKNPGKRRRNTAKWKKENPAKVLSQLNKRRAIKLCAVPLWADFKKIEAVYQRKEKIQIETGIKHEVDHIVPLLSPIVCGLHVETNLQIITSTENRIKGNRYWPDMPK